MVASCIPGSQVLWPVPCLQLGLPWMRVAFGDAVGPHFRVGFYSLVDFWEFLGWKKRRYTPQIWHFQDLLRGKVMNGVPYFQSWGMVRAKWFSVGSDIIYLWRKIRITEASLIRIVGFEALKVQHGPGICVCLNTWDPLPETWLLQMGKSFMNE